MVIPCKARIVMGNDTAAQLGQSQSQFSLAFLSLLVALARVSLIPIVWWGVSAAPLSFYKNAEGVKHLSPG